MRSEKPAQRISWTWAPAVCGVDFLEAARGALGYLNRMAFERFVDVVQATLVVAPITLEAVRSR